jgi:hypothetical protein
VYLIALDTVGALAGAAIARLTLAGGVTPM